MKFKLFITAIVLMILAPSCTINSYHHREPCYRTYEVRDVFIDDCEYHHYHHRHYHCD